MDLFFQKVGQGPPVIILHGLYGFSDNWVTVARNISDRYTVYLVDQRNHGRSPHDPVHTYEAMVSDLEGFILRENISKPVLVGHSMGGKTAMRYAALHPDTLAGLIVIDIGPGGYADLNGYSPLVISHLNIVSSMLSVDFLKYNTRTAIEEELSKTITDWSVRQFIMKNVQRNAGNTFTWKLNLDAVSRALPEIMGPAFEEKELVNKEIDNIPVFFIKGARSNYITAEQEELIHKFFPMASIIGIPDAGHWVHAEQPEAFLTKFVEILSTIHPQ